MAMLCRDYVVNDIFISAMIFRTGEILNQKVNFVLKQICEENGCSFVDNSNFEIRDLYLLESGKAKLAENFIYFFKNSYWLSPHDYILEAHTDGNIEHTYSQLLNTKNCESISDKSILITNTSIEAISENNVLKNLRLKNSNKILISHININSLRNKFELLTEMVWDKVGWWFPRQNLIPHSQTLNFTWNLTQNHTRLIEIAKEEV